MRMIVGISGASGAIYGVRSLQVLHKLGVETHLVLSGTAAETIVYETKHTLDEVRSWATQVHDVRDVSAAISSGSFKTDGMVLAPCSIKTLSGIANSYNDNLLTRSADVCLKERRKLVLVVRETPLHLGHLRLMTTVTEMGAVVLPPMPSFYHKPESLDDVINQTVGKILDQFGLEGNLFRRWTGYES